MGKKMAALITRPFKAIWWHITRPYREAREFLDILKQL